jgi:hypothetical protein
LIAGSAILASEKAVGPLLAQLKGARKRPLTEQSLKSVVFESRWRSKEDFDDALWLAIAQAADRKREILTSLSLRSCLNR